MINCQSIYVSIIWYGIECVCVRFLPLQLLLFLLLLMMFSVASPLPSPVKRFNIIVFFRCSLCQFFPLIQLLAVQCKSYPCRNVSMPLMIMFYYSSLSKPGMSVYFFFNLPYIFSRHSNFGNTLLCFRCCRYCRCDEVKFVQANVSTIK